jgi:hypothetical protein
VSTVECTASAAIAELRVTAAATNLHMAIATLATIAAYTTFLAEREST